MDVDSTANVLLRVPADVNGLLSCYDNITSRDQPSVNHPYLLIFDRVQVVDDDIDCVDLAIEGREMFSFPWQVCFARALIQASYCHGRYR